jgi:hypothetical protein
MRRASYREGVSWIAMNDEPIDTDVESIAGYISTLLLADLFGKSPDDVAADIKKHRLREIHFVD